MSISSSTANLTEYHWHADFGAGYDLIVPATMQVNFGIRIAEIKATNRVDSTASFTVIENGIPSGSADSPGKTKTFDHSLGSDARWH